MKRRKKFLRIGFLEDRQNFEVSIKNFTVNEVTTIIRMSNPKKSPGYDLITGRLLKKLPPEGLRFLTFLFNAILRTCFFPPQWKVAQVTMICKPGKSPNDVKSYRPISLLPIPSKIFESLLFQKMMPIIINKSLIPNHQFGFRQKYATIEQILRLTTKIHKEFEAKRYCSAIFLDISQAFDKVWHDGILFKI